jgi:hypothetical protein
MKVEMSVQYHADLSLLHFAFFFPGPPKLPAYLQSQRFEPAETCLPGISISGRSCIVTVELDVQRRSVSSPS